VASEILHWSFYCIEEIFYLEEEGGTMSFYFPMITSNIERKEYKQKVDEKLCDLYEDLKWLIHWENTFTSEMSFYGTESKTSDYTYLKNVIDKILERSNGDE
jgi:hypothetical protein